MENKESIVAALKEANDLYKEAVKKEGQVRREWENALNIFLRPAEKSKQEAAQVVRDAYQRLKESDIPMTDPDLVEPYYEIYYEKYDPT